MIDIELESFGLRFSKPTSDCLGVFFPLICWWKIPISLGLRLTGTSRICSGLRKMILLGHLLIISIPQPGTWSGWAPSSCFRQDWHWHPLSQGEPEARSSWGLCLSHVLLVKCYHQDGRTTTCTAGGGSLLLEFSLLSRLLGDPIYEIYARRAVAGLYSRRWVEINLIENLLLIVRHEETGLVGNVLDVHTGEWMGKVFFIDFCSLGNPLWKLQVSGLGAGVDSYYEILLKSFIMFGEPQVKSMKEVNLVHWLRMPRCSMFHMTRSSNTCDAAGPNSCIE